jgi:hypothetical protein
VHTIGFCLSSFSFTSDWVASATTGELANVSEPTLFSARIPSAPLQWEMQNPFADMSAELERIAKKPVIRADGVSGLDAAQLFDLHVSAAMDCILLCCGVFFVGCLVDEINGQYNRGK